MYSHLTRMSQPVSLLSFSSLTKGVLPTVFINPFRVVLAGLVAYELKEIMFCR